MHKTEGTGTACPEDNGKCKDGSTTNEQHDPWNDPFYTLRYPGPPLGSVADRIKKVNELKNKTIATNIIIPDCTPQWTNEALFSAFTILGPILEKDSVRSFLRFLHQKNARGMKCGYLITSETLNQIVLYDSLRCAELVLAGKNPKLHGFRANPNCMTQYGFLPLHRAAEIFSVRMIELLFRHGASANLRTSGALPTENLLPVHVAVANTCMHKYLEDSLYPNQEHLDCSHADINYILKLIHILCLPEMVCFASILDLFYSITNRSCHISETSDIALHENILHLHFPNYSSLCYSLFMSMCYDHYCFFIKISF
nr:uncharacterized protein LOC127331932 isoform X1 [Lolium perenne]